MGTVGDRLTDDEALRLECVRLSVEMAQNPSIRGDGDALINAAAAMEKFIKGQTS